MRNIDKFREFLAKHGNKPFMVRDITEATDLTTQQAQHVAVNALVNAEIEIIKKGRHCSRPTVYAPFGYKETEKLLPTDSGCPTH